MNILQLASFSGNIGDNAHVSGLRNTLQKFIGKGLSFTDLEIRRFYQTWKLSLFDSGFADQANKHDALIIGGGGFFDMNFPDSATGTTIDIAPDILDRINVPVIFYGLGCNQLQPPNAKCVDKFSAFLDKVLSESKYLVSVRNDGSHEVILKHLGKSYAKRIVEIPDPGFFFKLNRDFINIYNSMIKAGSSYLGICLAGDAAPDRYGDEKQFITAMAESLRQLVETRESLHLVFFAHIYQDLEIINGILKRLPDPIRRTHCLVAPCFQGTSAEQHIFSLYKKCDLVVSNRFHGVVVPFSLEVPTIAFCDLATRKVNKLSSNIFLKEYIYKYDGNLARLPDIIESLLGKRNEFTHHNTEVMAGLTHINNDFNTRIASMLQVSPDPLNK